MKWRLPILVTLVLLALALAAAPAGAQDRCDLSIKLTDATGGPVDGATLWLVWIDGEGRAMDIIDSNGDPMWTITAHDALGLSGIGHFFHFGPPGDYSVVAQYFLDGVLYETRAEETVACSGWLEVQFADLVVPR